MLTISGIHVNYGGSAALRGVNLTVSPGELVAVIGPNGAGKSTLLRTISGLVARSAGTVSFKGTDLERLKPHQIVRQGIVHVPEGRMVLGRMTVRDNLLIGAYAQPPDETEQDLSFVFSLFPRLKERINQLGGTLSGGEQQMLAIGRGLMGRPSLLMLDEPSLGLAPLVTDKIFETLAEIRRRAVTILLVEQNAERALLAADHGYVLDLGCVAAHGKAGDLLKDDRVRQAYLGL